jgi:3-deoxy-D-manno-octulosonic-acid transferase
VGGHNPLEAMQFGTPLVSGPATFNFAEAFAALQAADALITVADAAQLGDAVVRVLADPVAAHAQGERGRTVFTREGGATRRTLEVILALLDRQTMRQEAASAKAAEATVWTDPAVLPQADAKLFDPGTWRAQQAATAHAAGRNTVWFVKTPQHEMVLRHYWRGGLMGRLVKDKFLRQSVVASRAMAEYALLQRMRAWGLPVPRPCGALHCPAGLLRLSHYRADILVERIAGAQALSARLKAAALPKPLWQAVGQAIAHLHKAGVYHSDLNCHNILIDDADAVWLIDFDKCAVRAPGAWQQANLDRLLRSLRKEQTLHDIWHWADADWFTLERAYASG